MRIEKKNNFNLRDVGPIKNVDLNIDGITVILGLPNSGKSYALKSIYAYFELLDENKFKSISEIFNRSTRPIIKFENKEEIDESYWNNKLKNEINLKAKEIKDKKKKHSVPNEEMEYSLTLKFKISQKTMEDTVKSIIKNDLLNYTGSSSLNKLKFNNMTLSSIFNEVLISNLDLDSNNFKDSMFMTTNQILFTDKELFREYREVLKRWTIGLNIKIIEAKFQTKDIIETKFTFSTVFSQDNDTDDIDFIEGITRHVYQTRLWENSGLNETYFAYILSAVKRQLTKTLKSIYLKKLKSLLAYKTGIYSVKYIPYGRNLIIQMLNSSNKLSRFREDLPYMALSQVTNMPFDSYYKCLDLGREKLTQNPDEDIKMFEMMLNGSIKIDKASSRLLYSPNSDLGIDIGISSAMVQEIAGILLPIIGTNPGELVFIEEPESQLHISTQIIMGYILGLVAKKYNIKMLISTHSDVLALSLSYTLSNTLTEKDIKSLFEVVYNKKLDEQTLRYLSKFKGNISLNFYLIDEGKAIIKRTKEINESVPEISSKLENFVEWILNLQLKEDSSNDS